MNVLNNIHWSMALVGMASAGLWVQPMSIDGCSEEEVCRARPRTQPVAAAREGFRQLVAELLVGHPLGGAPHAFPFDVKDVSQLKDAVVEGGYQVHGVDPKVLMGLRSALSPHIEPLESHFFFVKVDGRVVGQVEVARVEGTWSMIGAGFAPLAREVHAVQSANPQASHRFVRIPQATADFLELQEAGGRARYVPLAAARASLGMALPKANPERGERPSESETGAEEALIQALQVSVRANLAAHAR